MARRDPTSLKDLFPTLLGRLAVDAAVRALTPIWAEIAGAQLARHATPVAIEGATLVVRVRSRAWAAEVEAQAPELCARLRGKVGPRQRFDAVVCRVEP